MQKLLWVMWTIYYELFKIGFYWLMGCLMTNKFRKKLTDQGLITWYQKLVFISWSALTLRSLSLAWAQVSDARKAFKIIKAFKAQQKEHLIAMRYLYKKGNISKYVYQWLIMPDDTPLCHEKFANLSDTKEQVLLSVDQTKVYYNFKWHEVLYHLAKGFFFYEDREEGGFNCHLIKISDQSRHERSISTVITTNQK